MTKPSMNEYQNILERQKICRIYSAAKIFINIFEYEYIPHKIFYYIRISEYSQNTGLTLRHLKKSKFSNLDLYKTLNLTKSSNIEYHHRLSVEDISTFHTVLLNSETYLLMIFISRRKIAIVATVNK